MRATSFVVLCQIFLFFNLYSAETLPSEKGYPRLFFTASDTAKLKDATVVPSEYLLNMKEMRITYLSGKAVVYQLPPNEVHVPEPPPGFNGYYPYWTAMSQKIRDHIQELVLSYYKTGDKRYAAKIIEYLDALSEWTTWNEFNNLELSISLLSIAYASGFDAVYELLDKEKKEKFINTLVSLGLNPIYRKGLRKVDHNVITMQYVALGLGGLLLLGENSVPEAASYVALAKEYAEWYLNKRHEFMDNEGIGYTSFVMNNLMVFADSLRRVTGDSSLLDSSYAGEEYPLWLLYSLAPSGKSSVMLADYSGLPEGRNAMKIIAKNFGNKYATCYLEKAGMNGGKNFEDIVYVLAGKEKALSLPALPLSACLKKQGLVSMRSSWDDSAVFCAFSSSESTCDHTHFDQNSFVLNLNGEWIFTDPGYRNTKAGWIAPACPEWRYTVMSFGHNTLLVDGKSQDKRGNGRIMDFFHSPWADYASGEAGAAYPEKSLKKYTRNILCIYPKLFIFFDELESPEPVNYELLFHPVSYAGISVGGKQADIRGRKTDTSLFSVSPDDAEVNIVSYPGAESYGNYAVISSKDKKRKADFISVIYTEARQLEKGSLEIELSPEMISTSSHKNFKNVHMFGSNALLFKAGKAGDFVSFTADIVDDGTYDICTAVFGSPSYGKFLLEVDGKVVGQVHDGYSKVGLLSEVRHGRISLAKGKHVLTYKSCGKNPESSDFFMGIISVLFKKSGAFGDLPQRTVPVVSGIKDKNFSGVSIKGSGLSYEFILNTSSSPRLNCPGGIDFSGKIAGIVFSKTAVPERYILINGTILKYNDNILIKSEFPCNVSFMRKDKSVTLALEIQNAGNVSLYLPESLNIRINGQSVETHGIDKDNVFEKFFEKGYYLIEAAERSI